MTDDLEMVIFDQEVYKYKNFKTDTHIPLICIPMYSNDEYFVLEKIKQEKYFGNFLHKKNIEIEVGFRITPEPKARSPGKSSADRVFLLQNFY